MKGYDPTAHIAEYIVGGVINGRTLDSDEKILAQSLLHPRQTDILLVGLNMTCIGTLIETGVACAGQTITIVAFNVAENLKSRPFIEGTVSVFCEDLEEAVDYIMNLS